MKFDASTLLGISAALALIVAAITYGGDIKAFFDVPSILIVLGGTFAVTTACFSIPEIIKAQSIVLRTIFYSSPDATREGVNLLNLAEEARKHGVLALQNTINSSQVNSFLRKGVGLVVDGIEPETAEKMLAQEVMSMSDRHLKGASILRKSAEIAPALGLIGTLIGLVQMLGNLKDPDTIGPAMAIALLTTLYGALLAYVVFTPLASKLERNSKEEAMVHMMYIKAVGAIARKENPRRLEMVLNTILPPAKRVKYFD